MLKRVQQEKFAQDYGTVPYDRVKLEVQTQTQGLMGIKHTHTQKQYIA